MGDNKAPTMSQLGFTRLYEACKEFLGNVESLDTEIEPFLGRLAHAVWVADAQGAKIDRMKADYDALINSQFAIQSACSEHCKEKP